MIMTMTKTLIVTMTVTVSMKSDCDCGDACVIFGCCPPLFGFRARYATYSTGGVDEVSPPISPKSPLGGQPSTKKYPPPPRVS